MGLFRSKELEQIRNENEELKSKFHFMYEKENNIKNLEEVLKRLRKEVAQLNDSRNSLHADISALQEEEELKKSQITELDDKIVGLNEMKLDLQNKVLEYTNRIDENDGADAEETVIPDTGEEGTVSSDGFLIRTSGERAELESQIAELNKKIEELNGQEAALLERISLKREEINELEQDELKLIEKQNGVSSELKEKIAELEDEKNKLQAEIETQKKQLDEYSLKIREIEEELNSKEAAKSAMVQEMEDENKKLHAEIESQKQELAKYSGRIKAMEDELLKGEEAKTTAAAELDKIEHELESRKKLVSDAEERFSKLTEDAGSKEKELYAVDQTLNIKSKRLSQINMDLLNYENKINELKEDVNNYEKLRSEYKEKLVSERSTYDDLFRQNQKLQELVPLLEKRRKEIEQGNAELENRFTKMFQKFNRELNEINKKRSVLEQIVIKKEKDIEEKDQLLFEKIAALEESDNVLNVRQVEIESFQSIIKAMTEQKEQIQEDLLRIDGESVERKNYIGDLRAETELLMQKKVQLEKGLHELLKMMSDNFYKAEERKLKLDGELKNYEDKLRTSREKINDSMRDLTELQSTIKAAKMEHEEYKTNISKMAAMKKRLHEEILKQQAALQKYQKLREKLKIEQALVKDKQIGGPYKGGESELNAKGKNDDPQRNAQIYKL